MRRSRSPRVLPCLLLLAGCSLTTEVAAPPDASSRTSAPAIGSAGSPPSTPPGPTPGAAVRGHGELGFTVLPTAIARSRAPRLAYVSGTTLHRPDGTDLGLDLRMRGRGGVTSIVAVPGGYLATDDRWFEGTVGMHRLDADGRSVDAWATTGPARLGPDGQVAWARVPVPEAMQTFQPSLHVDGRVQEVPGHIQPYILQFDGALIVYDAGVLRPGPVGRRTFETAVPGAPRPVARGQRERSLSPRRTHWWRWNRGRLELGVGEAVLVELRDRGLLGSGTEPVWEDDRHLLMTLRRGDRQTLLRIGVDGSVTRATPWAPASVTGHAVLVRVSRR